ncbi:hypothetical protein VU04_09960, partial [Desulfobulbus sp. TB]|nr:hypothetical protein [Desulfobulbus sp. TB]
FTTKSSIRESEKDRTPLPFVVEKIETDGTLSGPLAVSQQPNFVKKENDRGTKKVVNAVKIIKVIKAAQTTKRKVAKQEESFEQRPQRNLNKAEVFEVNGNNFVKKIPTFSPKELTQATQAVYSSKVNRNPLKTAKKLPIIHSASIIELKPKMKKSRPSDLKDSPPEKEDKIKTTAPPKQKILVPVASAKGIVTKGIVIRPAAQGVVVRPASQRVVVRPAVINTATTSTPSNISNTSNTSSTSASRAPAVKKSEPKSESIQSPKTITPSRADKANTLFAQYLKAGNRWNNKTYKDKFTVQLLVLSSDDVMKKIKDMIIREEYQEYKNTLYILRRNTVPPTLFVCYGVYSSIDEAKNAKDAMPLFLRKHHPYALPITEVLAKAKN